MKWSLAQQKLYRAQVAVMERGLGITEETRRQILHNVTGHYSTSEIDADQMRQVIDHQNGILRKARLPALASREHRGRISQEEFIAHLVETLGWTDEPARLAGYIRRMTNDWKDQVERLSTKEKSQLITALKRLLADQERGTAQRERQVIHPGAATARAVAGEGHPSTSLRAGEGRTKVGSATEGTRSTLRDSRQAGSGQAEDTEGD